MDPEARGGLGQRIKPWINLKTATALLMVSAIALLTGRSSVRPTDTPLPALPIADLSGKPLTRQYFDDRPWVINVWMPG